MMAGEVWTLGEVTNDGKLRDISFELLAWGKNLARDLGTELCSIVLGSDISDEELKRLFAYGADKVYIVRHPLLKRFLLEPFTKVLQHLVWTYKPEIFLAGATKTGRTVMPDVASKVYTGLTADCTSLAIDPESKDLMQTRPAIGGNILATIRTPNHRPQMATVRQKSIEMPLPEEGREGEIFVPEIPETCFVSEVVIESFEEVSYGSAKLDEAGIVVSGGGGIGSPENFKLVKDFASAMGGAYGSSRVPVDLGWVPYELQVGLSGKSISPDLYVACGISGAMQHLAGISTAKTIVAINNDKEAAIFQTADLGFVGDVNLVIPALIEAVKEYRESKK